MTLPSDPWAGLEVASTGGFTKRRVSADTEHDLFWLRSETDNVGLMIGVSGDVSGASLREARISIRNLRLDVRVLESGQHALLLLLDDDQNKDVFTKLCHDLVDCVLAVRNLAGVFPAVSRRLKKWQMLLANSSRGLLTQQEVQGLVCELCFLEECLKEDTNREDVLVQGWEGPDLTQHDFVLHNVAVEIKSIGSNQRPRVRISSEHQLETALNRLFLKVYFVATVRDQLSGISLNDRVRQLRALLTSEQNREIFDKKLLQAGYIAIPDYDSPLFRINETRTYLVSETFPRITSTMLMAGVGQVSYEIGLASISTFMIDSREIWTEA